MSERIYVQHVRHPLNPSQYVGTVAVIEKAGGRTHSGFSQCHPTDQFSKKLGRIKAIGRARGIGPGRDKDGNFLKPVPVKTTYLPNGKRVKLDVVGAAMRKLEQQVKMNILVQDGYTNESLDATS